MAFIHAGIYLGQGSVQLREMTGLEDLDPSRHYVVEWSRPNQTSGSPSSVFSGAGGQRIEITEMKPSMKWRVYEAESSDFGLPYSGFVTIRRALGKLGMGGSDIVFNNCQHFAVWARYGKKVMLTEDKAQATFSLVASGADLLAGNVILAFAVYAFLVWNIWIEKKLKFRHKIIRWRSVRFQSKELLTTTSKT